VIAAWNGFRGKPQDHRSAVGAEAAHRLPHEANRPQPALDANRDGGMTVTVAGFALPGPRLQVRGARPQHDPRARPASRS